MKTINYINESFPDINGWKSRHEEAVQRRDRVRGGSVATGIDAWCWYASEHARRFESPIGEDYVLGPAWARWGLALRELLNGDCGPLDCGTLDTIINDNLDEQGFTEDKRGEL